MAVGGASLPTLKERENEEISTASEDDTSPTVSLCHHGNHDCIIIALCRTRQTRD